MMDLRFRTYKNNDQAYFKQTLRNIKQFEKTAIQSINHHLQIPAPKLMPWTINESFLNREQTESRIKQF